MALELQCLLSIAPIETREVFDRRRTILYALGVGAEDLSFVYEEGLVALPTMAAVLAYPGFFWRDPRYGVDWPKVLTVANSVSIHRALPIEGELRGVNRLGPVYDRGPGKGVMVMQSRQITTPDGQPVATVRSTTFLRGDGGCGSSIEGPPPAPHRIPDRRPDAALELGTGKNQALIYRLSGDTNPLHIDPKVARAAGFDRPILHGLATLGIAGRALLGTLVDNCPERIRRIDARYTAPVFPGDTIETIIWREGPTRASFRARAVERDIRVLDNGYMEFE